ncbi:MAG TPA: single-stranded-DNA-specific exonuclease RecJ [Candidatus Saccharimonadia bacterium]|nr:single-stranded-DNA-specific exonuclease RecJ [Candidatus Saccharimonadia bacterium]
MTPARIVRRAAVATPSLAGIHPVLARIYAARGIDASEQLDHRLARLSPPDTMGGLDRASACVCDAIADGRPIVIVGDYDADGATGVAVAVRGLRMLGARDVRYCVPNRLIDGYGLTPALVASIDAPRGTLLVTVDNGIAAIAGVAAARRAGYGVVVTDHHLPSATLPDADAIVDPNLDDDAFPSKALAGVGVMFYLLLATRARLRAAGVFAGREPELAVLLDLVALGTVADLVPLDFNNRVLVQAGLRRMRGGGACAGIRALFAVAKRDPAQAQASDLGYSLGPRLNAAGRLEDMRIGIECLLCDDDAAALALAARLDAINAERRELQTGMVEQAEAIVAASLARIGASSAGLCLHDTGWHAGIVGLVASRIKERTARPVFAFAPGEGAAPEWRGSGRSVAGFHLRDALATIDARHPGMILRFGGHAMAAGLTLAAGALAAFAAAFEAEAERQLGPGGGGAECVTDGELRGCDVTYELAHAISVGGPWGQAFPEPVFDNRFAVCDARVVGARHWKARLAFEGCGTEVDAIHFGASDSAPNAGRVRAAYSLALDTWRGERRVQCVVRHLEPIE